MNPGALNATGATNNRINPAICRQRLLPGSLEITAGYPVFRPWPVFLDAIEITIGVDMASATTVS